MGRDVEIGVLLDEEPDGDILERFVEFWSHREEEVLSVGPYAGGGGTDRWQVWLTSYVRYYAPGHERGPWPTIYGYWRAFETFWPGQVRYGSDGPLPHEIDIFTAQDCERVWDHWAGPDGAAYYRDRRERQRAREAYRRERSD